MSVVVKNLTKKYGEQKAVDNLSFEAKQGEILGFLGTNGAGKTTTMKVITCFIPPTEGTVLVDDMDVQEQSLEIRKIVGYLPEHNPLYDDMYIKEYLRFIAGLHKLPNKNKRVAEMIEMTGLGVEQNKKIGMLSKGYRQRVGLAQAMIHDPKVLILDEPLSGLDPNQLSEIRTLIKAIGKEKTLIFSTHIMQEVQLLCDQVVIIDKGKMVAYDSIDHLQQQSKAQSIVTFEFKKAVDKALLQKIPNIKKLVNTNGNRWQIFSDENIDLREAVYTFAVNHQLTLLELHKETTSLENVFQELTT